MYVEKERKFIVNKTWGVYEQAFKSAAKSAECLSQYYLSVAETDRMGKDKSVQTSARRVRRVTYGNGDNPRYILTKKSAKIADASRFEEEIDITPSIFEYLIQNERLDNHNEIAKQRLHVPILGQEFSFMADVDIFSNKLAGLVMVEIEDENCEQFIPLPGWVEITDDDRFTNLKLSKLSYEEATALVGEVLNK